MLLMTRAILAPLALGVATSAALQIPASHDTSIADAPESIEWVRYYSDALAEARRTGKPIFLEFRCSP
jgi:hypothetical protein